MEFVVTIVATIAGLAAFFGGLAMYWKWRVGLVKKTFEGLAALLGGSLFFEESKPTHITGEFESYRVRLNVFGDANGAILSAGIVMRTHEQLQGHFTLKHDENAGADARGQLQGDDWDKDPVQVYFLSPHVCIRGTVDRLREFKSRWEQLDPGVSGAIVSALESAEITELEISWAVRDEPTEIKAKLGSSFQGVRAGGSGARYVERVKVLLHALASFATAAEQAWAVQDAKAGQAG